MAYVVLLLRGKGGRSSEVVAQNGFPNHDVSLWGFLLCYFHQTSPFIGYLSYHGWFCSCSVNAFKDLGNEQYFGHPHLEGAIAVLAGPNETCFIMKSFSKYRMSNVLKGWEVELGGWVIYSWLLSTGSYSWAAFDRLESARVCSAQFLGIHGRIWYTMYSRVSYGVKYMDWSLGRSCFDVCWYSAGYEVSFFERQRRDTPLDELL